MDSLVPRAGRPRRVAALSLGIAIAMVLTFLSATPGLSSGRAASGPGGHGMPASPLGLALAAPTSSEPAPVGVSDLGFGPGASPYEYNTSAWLDTANFYSLDVNGTAASFGLTPFLPAGGLGITLQQNVVLVFTDSGMTYYYWVQNVAYLTPGGCPPGTTPVFSNSPWEILVGNCPSNPVGPNHDTHDWISVINDIYNFSTSSVEGAPFCSGTGLLDNCRGSIDGSGMVYSTAPTPLLNVYAAAAGSRPGSNVNINFPAEVQLRVLSAQNAKGMPTVTFQYSDNASGWQTYDIVTFPFATAVSDDAGFQVNGFSPSPGGLSTDSEFDIGGFGDGSYSSLNATNVYMTLQYWNGHNYQTPANGFNFGVDTAESVQYANSTPVYHSAATSGQIGERVVNSTTHTQLKQVYTNSDVSDLVIQTSPPLYATIIHIGNKKYSFEGAVYNNSVTPGTYSIALYKGSHLVSTASVILHAGERFILTLS